jgi:hypothetical protein
MKTRLFILSLALLGGRGVAADAINERIYTNPAEIEAEMNRIIERNRGDPEKLRAELDDFNRQTAKALGRLDEYDREARLNWRYGPVLNGATVQVDHDRSIRIDYGAWRVATEFSPDAENALLFKLRLDEERYKGAQPQKLRVNFRTKGSPKQEEEIRTTGTVPRSFLVVPVAFDRAGGVVTAQLDVPTERRSEFVLHVTAEIEPDWIASSIFEIPMGVVAARE